MKYKVAKIFSSGTEYEMFKYDYCENGCIHHVERGDGFPELLENGGCPIEDRLECARFAIEVFPDVLLEVWDGERCIKWHHCPFYTHEVDE